MHTDGSFHCGQNADYHYGSKFTMKYAKSLTIPLIPSAYAIAWLVYHTISGDDFWWDITSHHIIITHFGPPIVMLFVLIAIFIVSVFHTRIKGSLRKRIFHLPLFLTPIAVTGHWAMIGFGFGGYGAFVHWLTKYPNIGPVNYEVLLGIICVLGSSFIPVVFAVYNLFSTRRTRMLPILLVFELILYGAVFIRLDLDSLYFSQITFYFPFVIGGPIIRMIPIPFMIYFTLISIVSHRIHDKTIIRTA